MSCDRGSASTAPILRQIERELQVRSDDPLGVKGRVQQDPARPNPIESLAGTFNIWDAFAIALTGTRDHSESRCTW